MNPIRMASGYLTVGIYEEKGKKPTTYLLHRLVLELFDGPPLPARNDARHLDGVKSNNQLSNLAWGSRSENMQDVVRHRSTAKQEEVENKSSTAWYPGYTTDAYLVRVGCELHAEGVLNTEHVARIWNCSRDVASAILQKDTRLNIERPTALKQKRRSPTRKAEIRKLVAEGKALKEINTVLSEDLTAQDLYYYKSKPKP